MRQVWMRFGALLIIGTAAGCAAYQEPLNLEDAAGGQSYQAQYRSKSNTNDDRERRNRASAALNAERCTVTDLVGEEQMPDALYGEFLSRGDLLRIDAGEDTVFTGDFEVSRDGMLKPPYLSPIGVQGITVEAVQEELRAGLVAEGYYNAPGPRISVRVTEFASAAVTVSGAVFEPGAFEIGRNGPDRDLTRQAARGASTEGRNLSQALRAAGGVRPDADLGQVRLIRGGALYVLDISATVTGQVFPDVMLLAGDQIEVASRNCFQEALMAPMSITAPGVKVFMSNLTQPASANGPSGVNKDARELRYGTRFTQAVVGMNCLGGSKLMNADRSAVLFSRNPITGASVVIERSIEELLRSPDRDDFDPFILPGDSLACYDSTIADIAAAARAVGALTILADFYLGI